MRFTASSSSEKRGRTTGSISKLAFPLPLDSLTSVADAQPALKATHRWWQDLGHTKQLPALVNQIMRGNATPVKCNITLGLKALQEMFGSSSPLSCLPSGGAASIRTASLASPGNCRPSQSDWPCTQQARAQICLALCKLGAHYD